MISGWVCEADTVEIVFEKGDTDATLTFEAGSGTDRLDTADRCGDTDNDFGLLFNWNCWATGNTRYGPMPTARRLPTAP